MSAPAVEAARLALDEALAAHRGPLPCRTDPDAWHGDAAQRQEAATACRPCPLRCPCLAAALAAGEQWGTWGGVDMEDPTQRRRALRQALAARRTTETTTDPEDHR